MTTVEELERAVVSLPEEEYGQFRQWFLERHWEEWDNQIEADCKAGKLDFLIKEAIQDEEQNRLKDL
jgi:hypothetical protein